MPNSANANTKRVIMPKGIIMILYVVTWALTFYEGTTGCDPNFVNMVNFATLSATIGFLFSCMLKSQNSEIFVNLLTPIVVLYYTWGMTPCNTFSYTLFNITKFVDVIMLAITVLFLAGAIFVGTALALKH